MANYKLAPNALADLERIWFYGLENWGAQAADIYINGFFEHFESLAAQPNMYPLSDIRRHYRRSICGQESVYYRVNNGTVEIMSILGRQDPYRWV